MKSQSCHMMIGAEITSPASAATFIWSMKASVGSVYISFPPGGRIRLRGTMMNAKIWLMKAKATRKPIRTETTDTTSRRRSSSRCSRNDIFPPAASSWRSSSGSSSGADRAAVDPGNGMSAMSR
jgi:hypothetical protein